MKTPPVSPQLAYYRRNKEKYKAQRKSRRNKWIFKGDSEGYSATSEEFKKVIDRVQFFNIDLHKEFRIFDPYECMKDYYWSMKKYNFDTVMDAVAVFLMLSSCDYQQNSDYGKNSKTMNDHCYRYGGIFTVKDIQTYTAIRFGRKDHVQSIFNGHIDSIAKCLALKKGNIKLASLAGLAMWVYKPRTKNIMLKETKIHPCPYFSKNYMYRGKEKISARFTRNYQGVPLKVMAKEAVRYLNFCRNEWDKPLITQEVLDNAYHLIENDLHRKDDAIKEAKPVSTLDFI